MTTTPLIHGRPVYADDEGLHTFIEFASHTQRVAVIECDLCDELAYEAEAIPINDRNICGKCAGIIMNLEHYKRSGRYVTWPNEYPPREGRRKTITPGMRRRVHERDYYACRYCGSRQNLVIDHVTPVSRGGKNTIDNLVTACATCNTRKHDREPAEAGMVLHPPHVFAPREEGSITGS